MPIRLILAIVIFSATWSAGCNRQDTDCLSRIGRKLAAHTKRGAGEVGAKVDISWPGSRKESSLQEKVQDRLSWENTLSDVTLEVNVKDKEIELKGVVKTAQQRLRAIELTETLAGVDKVTDSIAVKDAVEAAK